MPIIKIQVVYQYKRGTQWFLRIESLMSQSNIIPHIKRKTTMITWKYFLMGTKFSVVTNNLAFIYFKAQKKLTAKQTEISLLYQNTQPFYVVTLVKKNQRKSHYSFCSIPGIVLKDWLMKIVNTRINELFLFKSLSEKQYVNNLKLSKRN